MYAQAGHQSLLPSACTFYQPLSHSESQVGNRNPVYRVQSSACYHSPTQTTNVITSWLCPLIYLLPNSNCYSILLSLSLCSDFLFWTLIQCRSSDHLIASMALLLALTCLTYSHQTTRLFLPMTVLGVRMSDHHWVSGIAWSLTID